MLSEKSFVLASNLAGKIVAWVRDGMPLSVDNAEKLTDSCVCQ